MGSLSKASREEKAKKRKERWKKGDSAIQRAGRFLFNKESYKETKANWKKKREEKKTVKEGLKVGIKKGDKSPADKAGISLKQRVTAKKRHETFKADRKIKDKSKKSYNKGRKDQVGSAYERRQKDADTAMRDAARKRHKAWKEARAAKKNKKK